MDIDYLFIAKYFSKKVLRVTLQDTMYRNTFKQIFQSYFSKYLYRQYFDAFWGIGKSQTAYAKRVGFKPTEISEGFYVADKIFFQNNTIYNYEKIKDLNFLYVGRLAIEKNIINLATAISFINSNTNSNHRLTIVGEGQELAKLNKFNCINYLGFKSQTEIIKIAKKCHAFCLPSSYEPWGVVVHEMSALGLPILISKNCGSSFDLVENGFNGFKFDPMNMDSIVGSLTNFINLSNDDKKRFSINSAILAKKINHFDWNNTLNNFLN